MPGPLMIDIAGLELSADDREVLAHPLVGGVILFSRNYADAGQLRALTQAIHAIKTPPLLIAVDQEGGRVQRFRDGFTTLPPLRLFGECYRHDRRAACNLAETAGWLMAMEIGTVGVDFSFAPVVDLDTGVSAVIGDRAFHPEPDAVVELAHAWIAGVRRAGQVAVAKHFPGHGSVAPDTHAQIVTDERSRKDIARDIEPFRRLIAFDVAAMMMAHVIYPAVDDQPASLSRRWIRDELRGRLGFRGAVFCDDLHMRGVAALGEVEAIARQGLAAGCDMLPVCNDRPSVIRLLEHAHAYDNPASRLRLARLHGRPVEVELHRSDAWQHARTMIGGLLDSAQEQLNL
jgi:beta-N-acetylhexosaminidase